MRKKLRLVRKKPTRKTGKSLTLKKKTTKSRRSPGRKYYA